jgi:hypothetical protein
MNTTLSLHYEHKNPLGGAPVSATTYGRSLRTVSQMCHAFGEPGGHGRTRRRSKLSTGGHWRNLRDTGGHDMRPVRDREAPGSNPGPPTIFVFKTRRFEGSSGITDTPPYHNFLENYRNPVVH